MLIKDSNEKVGGSGRRQSGIVAIEGYMKFEHVAFVLKIYFRFRLLLLN
jgi:hypothetical protein